MNELEEKDDDELQNNESDDSDNKGWLYGIIFALGGTTIGALIYGGINARKLKKERAKNKVYQDILRKHQAEIDALKNAKEREEYKNRLWDEYNKQLQEEEIRKSEE